jgi:hypothetical protein
VKVVNDGGHAVGVTLTWVVQNMKLNSKEREASRRSPLITEVIFWSSQGNLEAVQVRLVSSCWPRPTLHSVALRLRMDHPRLTAASCVVGCVCAEPGG